MRCSRDGLSSRGRKEGREGRRNGGMESDFVYMFVCVLDFLCGCVCVNERGGRKGRKEGRPGMLYRPTHPPPFSLPYCYWSHGRSTHERESGGRKDKRKEKYFCTCMHGVCA